MAASSKHGVAGRRGDDPSLPLAVEADWEWQLRGACRTADGELFFHPYGEREPSRSRREQAAVRICASCPVLETCRDFALLHREPYGVWGGQTEAERHAVLARQGSAGVGAPTSDVA